jgi:hypothetical protein
VIPLAWRAISTQIAAVIVTTALRSNPFRRSNSGGPSAHARNRSISE